MSIAQLGSRSLHQCLRAANKCVLSTICIRQRISHESQRYQVHPRSNPSLQSHVQWRTFSQSRIARHGKITPPKPGEELHVTFIDKDGEEHPFEVAEGNNLLDIAHSEDLDMEGACEGTCSCSTCHVIVESDSMFDKIPEATDDENDMLDLAFGLTETSRLGCQVKMTKALNGLKVRLPRMTRNMQKSDFADAK